MQQCSARLCKCVSVLMCAHAHVCMYVCICDCAFVAFVSLNVLALANHMHADAHQHSLVARPFQGRHIDEPARLCACALVAATIILIIVINRSDLVAQPRRQHAAVRRVELQGNAMGKEGLARSRSKEPMRVFCAGLNAPTSTSL